MVICSGVQGFKYTRANSENDSSRKPSTAKFKSSVQEYSNMTVSQKSR